MAPNCRKAWTTKSDSCRTGSGNKGSPHDDTVNCRSGNLKTNGGGPYVSKVLWTNDQSLALLNRFGSLLGADAIPCRTSCADRLLQTCQEIQVDPCAAVSIADISSDGEAGTGMLSVWVCCSILRTKSTGFSGCFILHSCLRRGTTTARIATIARNINRNQLLMREDIATEYTAMIET